MTDKHWQLEKEYYTITAPSNLILRVVEHKDVAVQHGETQLVKSTPIKVHEFRVNLEDLAQASEHFKALLLPLRPDILEIKESDAGNVTGLATWLKITHYVVTPDTLELHMYEIWYVCSVAKKYGFDPFAPKAREWFDEWYNHQPHVKHFNFRDYEQLILPTAIFDHAVGFSHATKYLAYRSNGVITEVKPADFRAENAGNISSDPTVLVQINAARNRLTTVLHRALYAPISDLLVGNSCRCAPFLLFSYEKGLANTGCWPLHPALEKMSMNTVLDNLGKYSQVPVQTCGKEKCGVDFLSIVEKAVKDIEAQFAGLCLDCMETSASEIGSEEYWRHESFGVPWDDGCRTAHTQPSWFFSFMGPRSEMNEYLLNKTRDRANNPNNDRPSSYGYGNNAFPRGGNFSIRGDNSRGRGYRQFRNSQRPGRHDSMFSRPYYQGAAPGYSMEDVNTRFANANLIEAQDGQDPEYQVDQYGN